MSILVLVSVWFKDTPIYFPLRVRGKVIGAGVHIFVLELALERSVTVCRPD